MVRRVQPALNNSLNNKAENPPITLYITSPFQLIIMTPNTIVQTMRPSGAFQRVSENRVTIIDTFTPQIVTAL